MLPLEDLHWRPVSLASLCLMVISTFLTPMYFPYIDMNVLIIMNVLVLTVVITAIALLLVYLLLWYRSVIV